MSRERAATLLAVALGLASIVAPALVAATGTGTPTVKTYVRNNADVNDTTITFGTAFHDDVVVSGSLGTPSGFVVIRLYANGTCSGTAQEVSSPLALSGGIVDATAFAFIRPAGSWSFRAHYQGNATYAPLTGACEPFTVLKAIPLITTEVRNAADHQVSLVVVGATVHDFIHVSTAAGTATGTVTVRVYTDATCTLVTKISAATSLVNGQLDFTQFPYSPDHPGGFSFRATYNGNSQTQKATGPCEPFTVKAIPTVISAFRIGTTIVTSVPAGSVVNFATQVAGHFGVPTGEIKISFWINGTCAGAPAGVLLSLPLINGVAIVKGLDVGNVQTTSALRAQYTGDGTYFPRQGPCAALTVTKAIPNLAVRLEDATGHAVSSVPVGTLVHVAATVSGAIGTPTGNVYVVPATNECPGLLAATYILALVSGVADGSSHAQAFTTTGTVTYAVWYGGDGQYKAAPMQCIALAVTAAGSTPRPAPTAAPAATASTAPATLPTAAPSGVLGGSPSPEASSEASTAPASAAEGSPSSAASPGPSGSASSASGSSAILLLIGAIVVIAIVIGLLARRAGGGKPAPPA